MQAVGQVAQWPVVLAGTTLQGRVCAIRKSEEAIRQAHRRNERRASKKQTTTKPEYLSREYRKGWNPEQALFHSSLPRPAVRFR